ncbi:MAG: DUF4041 domain-containing protein [Bacteroidota bacterium]
MKNILLLLCFCITNLCYTQSEQLYKVTKNTSLKSRPASDAQTILRLAKDDEVIYLSDCQKYYCRITFKGKSGWVKKRLITKKITPSNQVTIVEEESQTVLKTPDKSPVENASTNDLTTKTNQQSNSSTTASTELQSQHTKIEATHWGTFLPWYQLLLLVLLFGLLAYLVFNRFMAYHDLKKDFENYKVKYQGIDEVNSEIAKRRSEFKGEIYTYQSEIKALDGDKTKIKSDIETLRLDYKKGQKLYLDLVRQQDLLKEDLDIAEHGVYEPQFDFETSGVFKLKIQEIREEQKQMIKTDKAVLGGEGWQLNGSAAKGRAMIKKQKKLMLRAFNGECDSFLKGVKWNNVKRIEERILRAVDSINKMGESQSLKIAKTYSTLKLIELKLTHEYNLKKYEEKEEQRRIREQIREEEKAKRDYEKAMKEAEKEENLLQKLMQQAQAKYAKASEAEKLLYESKLADLQLKLQEAQEKNQRALSMAQQTKAGHVYIISNIGSFGENIFKIGMTRRLEPMDRVKELGDASVPFKFDVHAIIYSENAPELENKLHKHFDKYRLNHINRRREYFNVSLHDIKKVVEANYGTFEFVIEPEAKEYRESLVIREQLFARKQVVVARANFPDWDSSN